MESITLVTQSQLLFKIAQLPISKIPENHNFPTYIASFSKALRLYSSSRKSKMEVVVVASSTATNAENSKRKYSGEAKGFVEEMRIVAMKLHTKDQAKEGEKEPEGPPLSQWEPSVDGYLKFLVDSKLVFDTLDRIVEKAAFPEYSDFQKTGLERSESLARGLAWFKEQGHTIPEPSHFGVSYGQYLDELSEKDPQALVCHFYNIYFAHSAGGRMIGKKVAQEILNNKELEFYKWEGQLSQLLQDVKEKLNRVSEGWTRDEKNRCLEETEISFKFSGDILRLILS